eukprot:4109597-Alexandrium_andersonii.AAC.1
MTVVVIWSAMARRSERALLLLLLLFLFLLLLVMVGGGAASASRPVRGTLGALGELEAGGGLAHRRPRLEGA